MSEIPNKVFVKQRVGTFQKRCEHFGGIDFTDKKKRCKAGVLMLDVIVEQPYKYRNGNDRTVYTSNHSMPCFRDSDPCGVCSCEHQKFPTPEEIAAHDEEVQALFSRTMVAREAIVKATDGKRGVAGEIACPVCESGKLRYSVASLNGHIHAGCTTENCVAWME